MCVTAIAGGVSALGGIYQAIQGAEQASAAQNALNNLKTPELTNVAQGLQVSTLGANLQREEGARQFATGVDALRSGGIRGVVGGLPSMALSQNIQNRTIGSDLDVQQKQIDQMEAEDSARIRALTEQRYQQDVAALSSQINAGQQSTMQGVQGIAQGAVSGLQGMQSQKNFESMLKAGVSPNQQKQGVNTSLFNTAKTTGSGYSPGSLVGYAPNVNNILTQYDDFGLPIKK